jgi:signal transduction histidine kinase
MSLRTRRTLNVMASIAVPPLLLAIVSVLNGELALRIPFGIWWRVIVLFPGFLFLAREFRIYALGIAVLYFPAMYWVAIYGSFYVMMAIYAVMAVSGADVSHIEF